MIVGLDTSILVRLLTGEPRDLALAALSYLLERKEAGDRVLVSDWVFAEAYSLRPDSARHISVYESVCEKAG